MVVRIAARRAPISRRDIDPDALKFFTGRQYTTWLPWRQRHDACSDGVPRILDINVGIRIRSKTLSPADHRPAVPLATSNSERGRPGVAHSAGRWRPAKKWCKDGARSRSEYARANI
jgi:hypothetical protein